MLRPFIGDAVRLVEFIGPEYLHGSFFETVFNALIRPLSLCSLCSFVAITSIALKMNRESQLRHRIRWLTWFFIIGLVFSGATAIPLLPEVGWLSQISGGMAKSTALTDWLVHIHEALVQTQSHYPMLFYGTDWLAFGHFMIALVFIGALRDPVRNRWLFDFGLIACALIVPYAFTFGVLRGIPVWWRLVDCSFGVFGAVPLWLCRRWTLELENCERVNQCPGRR